MVKKNKEDNKVFNGVFDNFTLNTLNNLKQKKYFDKLIKPIKTGKEGDVYLCKKDEQYKAIKIYRLTTANFKKISQYIQRDYRFKNIKGNLRKVILKWSQKEFRNLNICHKSNMNVPYPFKQVNNIIIMEYINGKMLKDTDLENPKQFFELLIEQLYIMKNHAKLIHGDLSEFNILVENEQPIIIDLGQSMTIKNEDDFKMFYDLYERDITNIVNYFNKKYDLKIKLENIYKQLNNYNN